MQWQNIKSWAKEQGYKADRSKNEDGESYSYTWYKIEEPSVSGTNTSVSKLATSIFNHITNNLHLEHQTTYIEKLSQQNIDHDPGFGFQ